MNKKNKGFTLVELLAVIVILGILLIIAVPATQKVIKQSKDNTFVTDAKTFLRDAKVKMSLLENPDKQNVFTLHQLNPELSTKYDGYVLAILNSDGSKYDYYISLRNNETGEYFAEKDFVETYTTTAVHENDMTADKVIKLPNTDEQILERMESSFNSVVGNGTSIAISFKNPENGKIESIALEKTETGELKSYNLLSRFTQVYDSSFAPIGNVWNDTGSELFIYNTLPDISSGEKYKNIAFKDLHTQLEQYRAKISTKPSYLQESFLKDWNLWDEAQKDENYDYSDTLIRLMTYKDLIRGLEIANEVSTDYESIVKYLKDNKNLKSVRSILGATNNIMWIVDDSGQCNYYGTVPDNRDDIQCYYLNLNDRIRSPQTILSGDKLYGKIPVIMVVGKKDRHKFVYDSGTAKDGKTNYTHIESGMINEGDIIEEK